MEGLRLKGASRWVVNRWVPSGLYGDSRTNQGLFEAYMGKLPT